MYLSQSQYQIFVNSKFLREKEPGHTKFDLIQRNQILEPFEIIHKNLQLTNAILEGGLESEIFEKTWKPISPIEILLFFFQFYH